jgi:hypothetical protein
MTTKYIKNWKSQCAFMRKMAHQLRLVPAETSRGRMEEKIEEIAHALMERADKIEYSRTPND